MQDQRWSGDDLVTKVQVFENELRAAGLSENTVNTYVGRADTFVRWLRGEYSPIGPNSGSAKKPAGTTMRGQALLDELAQDLDADQITRTLADYAAVTAYDASLNRLYPPPQATPPTCPSPPTESASSNGFAVGAAATFGSQIRPRPLRRWVRGGRSGHPAFPPNR